MANLSVWSRRRLEPVAEPGFFQRRADFDDVEGWQIFPKGGRFCRVWTKNLPIIV